MLLLLSYYFGSIEIARAGGGFEWQRRNVVRVQLYYVQNFARGITVVLLDLTLSGKWWSRVAPLLVSSSIWSMCLCASTFTYVVAVFLRDLFSNANVELVQAVCILLQGLISPAYMSNVMLLFTVVTWC